MIKEKEMLHEAVMVPCSAVTTQRALAKVVSDGWNGVWKTAERHRSWRWERFWRL
jgi:hypothetical protein